MKTFITIMVAVMMLLVVASPAAIAENRVGISYTDSYRWHGFGVFGDDYIHPGIQTQIGGIDIGAVSHVRDIDELKYWDTSLGYTLPIAGLNLRAGYNYLIFPGIDIQELSATVSLPGAIAPRYTIAHVIPEIGETGQFHIVGADFTLGDPDAISAVFGADVTYNDGVFEIEDWTHATAGLTLNVSLGENIAIQPGVFYQHTIEPEALGCDESEVWYAIGLSCKF